MTRLHEVTPLALDGRSIMTAVPLTTENLAARLAEADHLRDVPRSA